MSDIPILVDHLTGAQATTAVCLRCGWEGQVDPMDGEPICGRCRSFAEWKYAEGEKCSNCGAIDWSMPLPPRSERKWSRPTPLFCSRRCQLQGEYAAALKAQAAA